MEPPTFPSEPPYEPPYEPPPSSPGQPPPPVRPAASPGQPPAPYPSAPYPTGAPPAPYPPPPAKKRGLRRLFIALAGIAAVLLLGIGACTVFFVSAVKAPVDEANRFLSAIDSADYDAAAALLGPECNNGLDAAELGSIFGGADIAYDLKSSNVQNNRDAQVSGSFSATGAIGANFDAIEVFLSKRSGDWRVCGFQFN